VDRSGTGRRDLPPLRNRFGRDRRDTADLSVRTIREAHGCPLGPRMSFNYPHGLYVDREGSLYVADPVFPDASLPPLKFIPVT